MDADVAERHLYYLAGIKPHRRLGSEGNRVAVEYFLSSVSSLGYHIDATEFKCLDHRIGKAMLRSRDRDYQVYVSPYSLPCDLNTRLVHASTMKELEECRANGKILLLAGELCKEQLMPKNFIFYNPEHHKKMYSLIEQKSPGAVITATGKDLQMVGNIFPFNVFEDGDFDIPSVFCKDIIGDELVKMGGQVFDLLIDSERIPSMGRNVIMRKNRTGKKKIVICAHIDTKDGTPGASDNASGTTVLLLLAHMLKEYNGKLCLELVAINGEDNYSVAGEMDYLKRYGDELGNILLAVNIDDVGFMGSKSSFSLYGVENDLAQSIRDAFSHFGSVVEGEQWYAGDHMIFFQNSVPSMAITTNKCWELMTTITHTRDDIPQNLDPRLLVELADALKKMVMALSDIYGDIS